MTQFQKNLGLEALRPDRKHACFTFHPWRAVQSAITDLVYLSSAMHCITQTI